MRIITFEDLMKIFKVNKRSRIVLDNVTSIEISECGTRGNFIIYEEYAIAQIRFTPDCVKIYSCERGNFQTFPYTTCDLADSIRGLDDTVPLKVLELLSEYKPENEIEGNETEK